MNKKIGWKSIVLYVLAIIMAIYTLYAFVGAYEYIAEYVEYGYITYADSFGDIMAYYMSSVGSYLFYAVALAVMGYVLSLIEGKKPVEPAAEEAVVETAVEAEAVVEAEPVAEPVAVVTASAAAPVVRYCQTCYHVFPLGEVPEVCPECGAPVC